MTQLESTLLEERDRLKAKLDASADNYLRDVNFWRELATKRGEALWEIKTKQGKVCQNFELCDHVACESSYTSWVIADEALRTDT